MGKLQAIEQATFGGVDSLSNPITMPPSRFLLLRNWQPRPDGHLELREGFTIQPAGLGYAGTGPIHSMSPYTVAYHGSVAPGTGPSGLPFANGSQCVFFWRGDIPYLRLLDGGLCPTHNPVVRGNPIASSSRWQYALGKDGYLYMHNGTDMKFFDGLYLRDIGLPTLTQSQVAQIHVAQGLAAPTAQQADTVTFDFVASGTSPSQANAISGLMYMAYFDKTNDVLAPCAEPLSGAPFPSGHTSSLGYGSSFLRVNGLILPTKPGAVILLYYPGGSATPTLQPGTVCNFYPHDHTYNPEFEYAYPTDPNFSSVKGALPGTPSATFTLSDSDSLLFNPGFGQTFPGWTGDKGGFTSPMGVAGVTSGGSWDGKPLTTIWSNAKPDPVQFTMTVEGQISIPAAGDYSFILAHDDGAIIGFGDGATPVSGYIVPGRQTLTADKGYPVAMNSNTNKLVIDPLTVNFPAAGLYHFEIDYCSWESSQTCCLYNGDGTVIVPGLPSVTPADIAPSFIINTPHDTCTLSMLSPTQVNVNRTAHGFADGDIITLSVHTWAFISGTGADYSTPFSPVEWSSNGPFTIDVVDANNFTFNTPEAALYDGATPITVLRLEQITATTYIVNTDNSGWPTTSRNEYDTNQSGEILLPSPLDPATGADSLIPASAIGGAQPGYQFYASIYNPLTGHVGNRVAIGARIAPTTDTTFTITGLPDLSQPFLGTQILRWGSGSELQRLRLRTAPKQGQVVGLATSPGDSEWCLLIGRTGDGGEVPYACIDSAGNWIYVLPESGGSSVRLPVKPIIIPPLPPPSESIDIIYSGIDGNSELPTDNYIPPPFVCFWREGDRMCGAIDGQPFVYRSGSELDATTGIFVGDPAQAWNPAKVETFPTAQAIKGGFGYMQESWVFTFSDVGQLSELSGEVAWNGPYNFGIIGPYAFDQGWKGLPFWISKDKQLCTMLPGSDGPLPISTEYEAAILQRIGESTIDPTDANNSATASGTGTPQTSATLAPGNTNTLALFVSNADGATTPSGWTRMSTSKTYSKVLSSTTPISVSNPSTGTGAPSNEWANIIATLATNGTPAQAQHATSGVAGFTRTIVMPVSVTAGNCIIVAFSGNSPNPASGIPLVTDSQANTYIVTDITNSNSGYNVEAFLAIAIGCRPGVTTVKIQTSLEDGVADVWEYSAILGPAPDHAASTELVYFRDPVRMVEVLRIKCLDANGLPFVVIHDFNLRDDQSPYGQGYEADYLSTLASDFTSIRIRDHIGRARVWAGGADARFYEFYLGGNDNGVNFTADAISLRYVSGERSAVKTVEWYGDEEIVWYCTDDLTSVANSDSWTLLSDQSRPFPGDEGNAHYQTDLNNPEVIHLLLWVQLISHPADAPNPAYPMTLSVPPHLPLETYGRLYLAAPLIGDTRGR